MTRTDWLPQNHEELHKKAELTHGYLFVSANRTRMGFGATAPYGEWYSNVFLPKYLEYTDIFGAWVNPKDRTPLKMDALVKVEKEFIPIYRQLYTGMLKGNPLVTDIDLDAMGLPKRGDGGQTPSPVSDSYPDFDVDSSTIRRLIIDYYDKGQKKNSAKPAGQHGAEIRWAILKEPPTDISELRNSSFDTHTPHVLDFLESERGETVYLCLRWENTRGEKGPWGEIQSAIIP
jgi:hypothetical protein